MVVNSRLFMNPFNESFGSLLGIIALALTNLYADGS
jgi:hypothetical protein